MFLLVLNQATPVFHRVFLLTHLDFLCLKISLFCITGQSLKLLFKFIEDNITESNDYKRTRQYNKLTPKMKRAVDMVFRAADKDADVIANFEKNVDTAAKQFGVRKQDLMKYFDKETLTILRR